MRITNQMISNNSLRNMQKTMANVDNRTTQMETGKKITKASEDPVVAVRALKLRTEDYDNLSVQHHFTTRRYPELLYTGLDGFVQDLRPKRDH